MVALEHQSICCRIIASGMLEAQATKPQRNQQAQPVSSLKDSFQGGSLHSERRLIGPVLNFYLCFQLLILLLTCSFTFSMNYQTDLLINFQPWLLLYFAFPEAGDNSVSYMHFVVEMSVPMLCVMPLT